MGENVRGKSKRKMKENCEEEMEKGGEKTRGKCEEKTGK